MKACRGSGICPCGNDLFRNLSANDPSKVAVGGLVFEWNDEWWKVSPPGSQQTNGFALLNGHPDGFANEEFFGITTIERRPRLVYGTLATAFNPGYRPPSTVTFRALSRGGTAQEYPYQLGVARFFRNGQLFYQATGGGGGGRGFNVATINPATGQLTEPVQNFDTWFTRETGTAMNALVNYLNGLLNGTLVMIAVADDAGLTLDNSCTLRSSTWAANGIQVLEALGSRQIRSYCFRNSWAFIVVKGEGRARDEGLASGIEVSVQAPVVVQ